MDKMSKTNVDKLFTNRKQQDHEWKRFPAVRMVLFVFRVFYAWPEKGMDPSEQFRYRVKGIAFRWIVIYLSVAAQAAYICTIEKRQDLIDGLFVLSTQLVLILKIEFLYKNISKIQHLFYQLDAELYASRNAEEDVPLANARKKTSICGMLYFMFSDGLITYWLFYALTINGLIVPSWYPFDYTASYAVYLVTLLFQVICMLWNAAFNISWDSLVYILLSLANAQLQRLQIQLLKIGHNKRLDPEEGLQVKSKLIAVKPAPNQSGRNDHLSPVQVESAEDVYNDLLRCVIFHQKLIKFVHQVLELFGGIIVVQLFCSVFIICIAEFHLLTEVDTVGELLCGLPYLICMLLQVYQYCFHGNEISYTSQKVHQATAFVNYPDMNIKTRKLLILFQQRTAVGIPCYAKNIFKIELSNATFVAIIKSSYSFLAVLRTMID
ncbi:odorant receptor Or1-like [Anopheles ziemanni]|uniref:odorant receptor Or1-like n=1 Tax=Anopheles coustani TaxID=139045 RepID=UPI00265B4BB0|nr:odorant receptor Or1-like [Anopheles coustani]XP_058177553.1 odorant receptor Or1-like [Anopheles ziemanni]